MFTLLFIPFFGDGGEGGGTHFDLEGVGEGAGGTLLVGSPLPKVQAVPGVQHGAHW